MNVVDVVVPAIPNAAQLHDDSDSHPVLETDDGLHPRRNVVGEDTTIRS